MSRIADLLRKTRERERERNPTASGVEPGGDDPQWMTDVDNPWQLGPAQRPVAVPPVRAPQRPVPPEVAEVVRRLFFSDRSDGKAIHRVLFSAVGNSAGNGSLARQVAEGLASMCTGSVCLADLNLRRPTLGRYFGFQGRPGFADIVIEADAAFEVAHPSSSMPRLLVMPAGTRTAGALSKLADPEALARLVRALSRFEFVVALTAPLGEHRDAVMLAAAFDGVVLVADSSTSDPAAVRAAARALGAAGIRLLGTIVENAP